MTQFDPYHRWLGIPPQDQPPHHYRLLGLALFEENLDVIESAADRCMAFVQQCAIGEHMKESQEILNELSAARVCLLVPETKQKYDSQLREKLDTSEPEVPVPSKPAPPPEQIPVVAPTPELTPTPVDNSPEDFILIQPPNEQTQLSNLEIPVHNKKLLGVDAKIVWIAAGGICLFLLTTVLAVSFMGDEENKPIDRKEIVADNTPPEETPPKVNPPNADPPNKVKQQNNTVTQGPVMGQTPIIKPVEPISIPNEEPTPISYDPKYIDPDWIERRLKQVGFDRLLLEYSDNKGKEPTTIYLALRLSQRILKKHPEALREQLQARLVSQKDSVFAPFQKLPDNRIQFHSEWATIKQPSEDSTGKIKMHSGRVNCVALSQDGQNLVSGSSDKTLKVWDISNGKLIRTLKGSPPTTGLPPTGFPPVQIPITQGHLRSVTCVALVSGVDQVISGSDDSKFKVWNLADGKLLRTLTGHASSVTCMVLSPDHQKLVSGSYDKTIRIWDISNGNHLGTLRGQRDPIRCVTVTSDGKYIIAGSADTTLKVWNLASNKLRKLKGHTKSVTCVAMIPGDKRIVSGSADNLLKIWNTTSGRILYTLKGHSAGVNCMVVIQDGKQIISGSADQTIKVWDIASRKLLATYQLDDVPLAFDISRDSKTLYVGGSSGRIHKLRILIPTSGSLVTSEDKKKPTTPTTPIAPVGKPPGFLLAPFSKRRAKSVQRLWARHLGTNTTVTNTISMKLVMIPPGQYKRGAIKDKTGHQVRITKPFYMTATEVTQKQWKSVMNTTPWKGNVKASNGDDYPVTHVNPKNVQEFIDKLNIKEKVTYRLPTEAEWEYACRAGTESSYCFGESTTTLLEYAWFNKNSIDARKKQLSSQPVGQKKSNHFGLHDMHGNVSELCSDWYNKDYYKQFAKKTTNDPQGPQRKTETSNKVVRGGSFMDKFTTSSSRGELRDVPPRFLYEFGFRLVRVP